MGQERGAESENRIALSFVNEGVTPVTSEMLDRVDNIGINLLEISAPAQLNNLSIDSFFLLLTIDEIYSTPSQLTNEWRAIAQRAIHSFQEVDHVYPEKIAAINLFQYPDEQSELFFRTASIIADTLLTIAERPLYYQTHRQSAPAVKSPFRFVSVTYTNELPEIALADNVINFKPSENLTESLKRLERLFNATIETDEPIIIIPAEWFFDLLDRYPDMDIIFSSYINGKHQSFPLPNQTHFLPSPNWPIILLLMIWMFFAVLYRYRPLFMDNCSRYFLSHRFFVIDVIENRNRNLADGLYMVLLHIFVSALFFQTASFMFFGKNGLDVLSHYFPYLIISNYESISLFMIGIIFAATFHTISIFWIYLFNKSMRMIAQAVNLYVWPFIINLIVMTLLVLSYQMGGGQNWPIILTLIYFSVWFFSFNIAAINGARFMDSFKISYILLTVGIYFVFISALIIMILLTPSIFEPVRLAYWLP
ncbi:MAG: hypothetical protein WD513_03145 [Balneolaceae bacterium]